MSSVNYITLKNKIIKSCANNGTVDFTVNMTTLKSLIETDDLYAVKIPGSDISDRVMPKDIIPLTEYYKDTDLKWIDNAKTYTHLAFIKKSLVDNDDELKAMITEIENGTVANTGSKVSNLLATQPFYFAAIIRYQRYVKGEGYYRSGYFVRIRANSITIKNEGYGYVTV